MTDYNDGKWHGWNGGKCPVHESSEIDWMLRSGKPQASDRYAGRRSWAHFGYDSDIIAFRVTKVHREPREWWIDPVAGIVTPIYHAGFIQVREVL